jgi:hypothetical protein
MTTEIYSCLDGQSLEQGKLDVGEIASREEALADAERRCSANRAFKKIVYYNLSANGDFRVLFSYSNPHWRPAPPRGAKAAKHPRPAARKAKPKAPARPTLLARLMRSLGLD